MSEFREINGAVQIQPSPIPTDEIGELIQVAGYWPPGKSDLKQAVETLIDRLDSQAEHIRRLESAVEVARKVLGAWGGPQDRCR